MNVKKFHLKILRATVVPPAGSGHSHQAMIPDIFTAVLISLDIFQILALFAIKHSKIS